MWLILIASIFKAFIAFFEVHLWYRMRNNLNLVHFILNGISLQPDVLPGVQCSESWYHIYIRHLYTIRCTADIFSLNIKAFWLNVFFGVQNLKHLLSHKLEGPQQLYPQSSHGNYWHVISIVNRSVLWRRDAQENRALPQLSWKPHQSPCLGSLKTDQPL